MNEERLSRHITLENLRLRSENSQLVSQMEEKDIMLDNKDGEILRLLNQIASDMVRRSDVDEIVKKAVAEENQRLVTFYEKKMKEMAAGYEAQIAELQKTKSKSKSRQNSNGGRNAGGSTSSSSSKSATQVYDTKEDALAALESAQKKIQAMADQAFGGGGEKLSAEQKVAVNPEVENADDDSMIKAPVKQRGNYGITDYEPTPRSSEYCEYGEADDAETVHRNFYPEGCDENTKTCGERTVEQWEVTLPKLQ